MLGLLLEQAQHHRVELVRDFWSPSTGHGRRRREVRVDDRARHTGERRRAREDLGRETADRVEVGARIVGGAGHAFGRHVLRRAPDHVPARQRDALRRVAGDDLGHSEVEHLQRVVDADEHEVGRLQIAVQHAARVRVVKRVRELCEHVQRARHAERRAEAEQLEQRRTLGVLHRDVEPLVGQLTEVVQRDDVRMAQPIDRTRLAPEPRNELRVLRRLRLENLQRLSAAELEVLGEPDLAHAAAA